MVAEVRQRVSNMAGVTKEEVRIVASSYRICPLGAHIDHQLSHVISPEIRMCSIPLFDKWSLGFYLVCATCSGDFEEQVRFRLIVLRMMSQLAKHNLTKADYINYQDKKKLNFLDDLTHAKPDMVFFLPLTEMPSSMLTGHWLRILKTRRNTFVPGSQGTAIIAPKPIRATPDLVTGLEDLSQP
ncbi:hypothetical protein AHAS_Ahas12G0048200 [Arachis hypogaea]